MKFEDYFSKISGTYAQYRPSYPDELFAYLAGETPEHELAWDCGTGNGQAALGLVNYFDLVVATDASQEQISKAQAHERIRYQVEPARQVSLNSGRVDLVTVAVAVHWFDFDQFYREVQRVLKTDGIIAVWTYYSPIIQPDIDALIELLNLGILDGYWPEQLHYLREHYRTLPFPFAERTPPDFAIDAELDLNELLGFISSWSAVRKYQEQRKTHPINEIWEELSSAWGDRSQRRHIRWPLYMRVGSKPSNTRLG